MKEIWLYVEGGGDKESKARLREAFSRFLGELTEEAHRRGIRWRIVLCGSREDAHKNFLLALRSHPDALNLLLVDAERPVTGSPRAHLQAPPPGDGWSLSAVDDEQCHLMVQVMESWFLADPHAVAALYGNGFNAGSIPKTRNVEKVAKADLLDGLKRATKDTQKGEYHKTRHVPQILERLDPAKVRARAPHCDRLWQTLQQALGVQA